LEKTCPSAALSTTNPTCCPYANPGRRGGKPVSNRSATARPIIRSKKTSQIAIVTGSKEINRDNLKNIRHETSRHFRNKNWEYLKDNIKALQGTVRTRISETYIEE
jgi:hypothetical protein